MARLTDLPYELVLQIVLEVVDSAHTDTSSVLDETACLRPLALTCRDLYIATTDNSVWARMWRVVDSRVRGYDLSEPLVDAKPVSLDFRAWCLEQRTIDQLVGTNITRICSLVAPHASLRDTQEVCDCIYSIAQVGDRARNQIHRQCTNSAGLMGDLVRSIDQFKVLQQCLQADCSQVDAADLIVWLDSFAGRSQGSVALPAPAYQRMVAMVNHHMQLLATYWLEKHVTDAESHTPIWRQTLLALVAYRDCVSALTEGSYMVSPRHYWANCHFLSVALQGQLYRCSPLLQCAVFCRVARQAGLEASIVRLPVDSYVRIEDAQSEAGFHLVEVCSEEPRRTRVLTPEYVDSLCDELEVGRPDYRPTPVVEIAEELFEEGTTWNNWNNMLSRNWVRSLLFVAHVLVRSLSRPDQDYSADVQYNADEFLTQGAREGQWIAVFTAALVYKTGHELGRFVGIDLEGVHAIVQAMR